MFRHFLRPWTQASPQNNIREEVASKGHLTVNKHNVSVIRPESHVWVWTMNWCYMELIIQSTVSHWCVACVWMCTGTFVHLILLLLYASMSTKTCPSPSRVRMRSAWEELLSYLLICKKLILSHAVPDSIFYSTSSSNTPFSALPLVLGCLWLVLL